MFQHKYGCPVQYISDQKGNYRETLCTDEDAIDLLGWAPQDRLLHYIQNL